MRRVTTEGANQSYGRRANEYIDALGSIDALDRIAPWKVEEAGFTVTFRDTRVDPGSRPHGAIVAHRRS